MPFRPARPRECAAVAAALGFGIVVVALVHGAGVSWGDITRLLLTYAATIVVPGLIMARRLVTFTLVGRLSVAFTTGIVAQLAGWAIGVALHQRWLVAVIPLIFAVAWDVGLRRVSARRNPHAPVAREPRVRAPWWMLAALALSSAIVMRSVQHGLWRTTPLDYAVRWYQDMDWHVAITVDAMRHVPPNDPQSAADGPLGYHWFSNAHTAALSLVSGADIDAVSIIVWFVPVILATLGVAAEMTVQLSRSPLAGTLAPVLIAMPPAVLGLKAIDAGAYSALVWQSPSHLFSLPITLLLTWLVLEVLRAKHLEPHLIALALALALIAPGTKVSLLPTVLGGVGLVALRALLTRRPAGRAIVVAGVGVLIVIGTAPAFAGGGGGSTFLLGATARQTRAWATAVRDGHEPGALVLTLLVVALVATFSFVLLARAITDVTARWMFAGMFLVAALAVFLLAHPSLSQVYFMRGLQPVIAVFGAWGFATVVEQARATAGARRTTRVMVPAFLVALGVAAAWRTTSTFTSFDPLRPARIAPIALACLIGMLICWLALRDPRRPLATALVAALLLGVASAPPVRSTIRTALGKVDPPPSPPPPGTETPLTADEITAGRALTRANRSGELVATNVHCRATVTKDHCDARAFWVSSLTHSPVFIGAWGYSTSARTREGVDGYGYLNQRYADPRAYALNERAFAHPDAATLDDLAARGVRYLYADSRASRVSPALNGLAKRVFHSDDVSVYELPAPSARASAG